MPKKSILESYIYQNRTRVFINLIFCFVGIVMGCFAFLSYTKSADNSFFYEAASVLSQASAKKVFTDALWDNFFVVLVFYVLSLFSIGEFLTSAYVLVRCISYGLSACILINAYGLKGTLLCMLSLMPQCIFYISALIFFATETAKQCRYMAGCYDKTLRRRAVFSYFLVSLFAVFMIFLGCLVEGFISRYLMLWCLKKF